MKSYLYNILSILAYFPEYSNSLFISKIFGYTITTLLKNLASSVTELLTPMLKFKLYGNHEPPNFSKDNCKNEHEGIKTSKIKIQQ
jgi:hypothetical protein